MSLLQHTRLPAVACAPRPACRGKPAGDVQVFEEIRNLCLGLAARGMPWPRLGRAHTVAVWLILINKLFANLFARSTSIAESLRARGITDPAVHHLNIPVLLKSSILGNLVAAGALGACVAVAVLNDPAFATV